MSEHPLDVLDLAVARGEVPVPEKRHLLAQRVRAVGDAIQPIGLEPLDLHVGDGLEPVAQDFNRLGFFGSRARRVKEPLDTRGGTGGKVTLELGPRRAEAGPAVQVGHFADIPRLARRGHEGAHGSSYLFIG